MITKKKLTITINEDLLEIFDSCCNCNSTNKSKLISSMIMNWCEEILPIPQKYLSEKFKDVSEQEFKKIWNNIK